MGQIMSIFVDLPLKSQPFRQVLSLSSCFRKYLDSLNEERVFKDWPTSSNLSILR